MIIIAALLAAITAAIIQLPLAETLAADDGIRHLATARELLRGDFFAAHAVPWLPYSFFKTHQSDPWFLYHWIIIPFAAIPSYAWGLKLLGIASSAALAASFAYAIRTFTRRFPLLFTALFLFGSELFLFRIQIGRAFTITLAVFLLALALTFRRRSHLAIACLVAVGLLIHAVGIIIPAFLLLLHLVRREPLSAAWPLLLGTLVGIALRPHPIAFIAYLPFLARIPLASLGASGISFGREVYGLDPVNLFADLFPILGIWIPAVSWSVLTWRTQTATVRFLALSSAACFLLMLATVRFFDFYIPLALLFAAAVAGRALDTFAWQGIRLIATGILVVFVILAVSRGARVQEAGKDTPRISEFEQVMQPISTAWTVPRRPIIANMRWDTYPLLVAAYSPGSYVAGMDPALFETADANRFWKWYHLSTDILTTCGERDCARYDDPDTVFRADLRADFIFVEPKRNPQLAAYLRSRNDAYHLLSQNSAGAVFSVVY